MAKQNNTKSDYMSEKMDEQLGQLEDKITVLYANASYEVNQEWAKFSDTFKAKDATMLEKLENGEITQAEYTLWRNKNILQTDMYKATVSHMTDILTQSDITAMAMVNDEMPAVVAENYNFVQALGWKEADEAGLSVGTFQIYNAESVQKIVRDNPDLLKSVDVPEDKKWNKDHINREITTGIIKGESLPKVADRLARVTDMDKNSAVRNARTAMTYAENLGRAESADKLKNMGIPEDEVWSATYDNHTRDSHLLLDGTKRDEKTGKFGEGILKTPLRCPADPEGDPEEIYNCRCRLNIVLQGIDHSKDDDLYEQFMKENYPDDWAKLQASESEQAKRETAEQTKEYQSVLKEIQKEGYYDPDKASKASEDVAKETEPPKAEEATESKSEASEGYKSAEDLEKAIMADGGKLDDPRLVAYSNALEEEQAYTKSLETNLKQAINENGYTTGIKVAIEAEEKDAQRTLDNMPEYKSPEEIAQAEALQERLQVLSDLKPDETDMQKDNSISSEAKSIPVMPSNVREYYNKFEDKYTEAKTEHGALFSKDGELISESQSKRGSSVSIATESTYEALGDGAFEIHNHPADELYSWIDVRNYENYGMNGTITIPSGYECTLLNTNEPRWKWSDEQKESVTWLSSAWNKAQEEISDNWLSERREYVASLQDSGLSREDRRTQLRLWDENNSRIDRGIAWFEENSEKYGFIFEYRRIK